MITTSRSQNIYLLACCYNEGRLLPFFLDYYCNFIGVSKVFLYDGGSTDNTSEIIKDYPVEMFVHKSDKLDDRQLMYFRNECYKQWRNECDWFIVCDIDEFLYHPDIHTVLAQYKSEGITLPMVHGYEMLSKEFPVFKRGDYLPNFIQTGFYYPAYYNKHLIFDPVIDINYTLGCHQARPTGPVKQSPTVDFKNLHHKILSYDYFLAKATAAKERLSDWNKQVGAGSHYEQHAAKTKAEFLNFFVEADNVFEPVKPLLDADPLGSFLSAHLLQDTEEYRLLDLSNWGRYPSSIGSTFSLVQKRFGGRHLHLEHPPSEINLGTFRALLNLDARFNAVYLDASMLKVDHLNMKESFNTLLSILIAQSASQHLLLMLDLSAADDGTRGQLLDSDVLLRRFDLFRHDAIVVAKLKQTAR